MALSMSVFDDMKYLSMTKYLEFRSFRTALYSLDRLVRYRQACTVWCGVAYCGVRDIVRYDKIQLEDCYKLGMIDEGKSVTGRAK
jgi:hypothetical protein